MSSVSGFAHGVACLFRDEVVAHHTKLMNVFRSAFDSLEWETLSIGEFVSPAERVRGVSSTNPGTSETLSGLLTLLTVNMQVSDACQFSTKVVISL